MRQLSTAAASRACRRSPFGQNREAGLGTVFRGVIVRSVCIAILLIVGAGAAGAATIEIKQPETGPPLVLVTGDFEFSDVADFNGAIAPLSKATVSFASEGGALLAGIRIGTMIRQKRFSTLVPDGTTCASACAVAWLGGTKRFVGRGANVGFHAAYVVKAGTVAESAPGNAVLGAYLGQIGLSEEAIRYITDAEPSAIHWMSMSEAAEYGIAVARWGAAEFDSAAIDGPPGARDSRAAGSMARRKPHVQDSSLKQAHQGVRALFAKLSKLNPIPRVRAATRSEAPISR